MLAIINSPANALIGLFHTATGTAFADIAVNGARQTWPVRSSRFRAWLRRCHYKATGNALGTAAIRSTLELLEARALFDSPERTVHVRIAEHGGHIYLDLADDCWHAVEIGPDGWRVIGCPPVRFRRPAGMLPLPAPERGGSVEPLGSLVNLPNRSDFVLIVAWLLAALRCGGPYPLLAISGEQGSAKTILSKLLRALIDPNAAPVRALAREERELMIAANNGHLLAFDNLAVSSRTPDPVERDRGCRLPPRSGRPSDLSLTPADPTGATALGGRALARIPDRAARYPGRSARRSDTRPEIASGPRLPSPTAAPNGRFRTLDFRL